MMHFGLEGFVCRLFGCYAYDTWVLGPSGRVIVTYASGDFELFG